MGFPNFDFLKKILCAIHVLVCFCVQFKDRTHYFLNVKRDDSFVKVVCMRLCTNFKKPKDVKKCFSSVVILRYMFKVVNV